MEHVKRAPGDAMPECYLRSTWSCASNVLPPPLSSLERGVGLARLQHPAGALRSGGGIALATQTMLGLRSMASAGRTEGKACARALDGALAADR
ncbi:MAG: hypothetical protein RL033_4722, partial [Pseudomonadota bacterium]